MVKPEKKTTDSICAATLITNSRKFETLLSTTALSEI